MLVASSPGVATAGGNSWHWLNPQPRGDELLAVDIAPNQSSVAYAVGANGCILKTYDSGVNWVEKGTTTPETGAFYAVFTVSDQIAYVGGKGGVYKTTNGASFGKQSTLVPAGYIKALFFRSANLGWAADDSGVIWRTANGGTTWTATTIPGTPDFTSIAFRDDANGYAITGSTNQIYMTTDGGVTWLAKETKPGVYLKDIAFNPDNTQVGWIVGVDIGTGADKAYRTADGGTTWGEQVVGVTGQGFDSVAFPPSGAAPDTVWMTHFNQLNGIVKVLDSATPVWSEVSFTSYGQWQPMFCIDAASPTAALAVGAMGCVTSTSDGGTTWKDRAQVIGRNWLTDVQFLDLRTGYVTSQDGGVWKTTNAGVSWSNTLPANTFSLHGVFFLDTQRGWAVGSGGKIFSTHNGGSSWTPQTSGVSTTLNAVVFTDANHGWTCGSSGTLLYTDNGGGTWVSRNVGLGTSEYKDVDFVSNTEGAVVGAGPKVFATIDGGQTWTPGSLPAGANGDLNAVDYVSTNTFLVAGQRIFTPTVEFSMLKTTNGGSGFSPWPNGTHLSGSDWGRHQAIFDMQWTDANKGFVLFQDGTLASTTSGGANMSTDWTFTTAIDSAVHADLSVVNASAMWIVGPNGRVKSNYWYSPTVVYRFFHLQKGTHFYTKDVDEKHNIINTMSHIYKYEGTGYTYDPYYAPDMLHRFYNHKNGTHFYTADPDEFANVDQNMKDTYSYDGPSYGVSRGSVPGRTVWRFYNKRAGSHFYTADPDEKANVETNMGEYFTYEGPSFYLPQ